MIRYLIRLAVDRPRVVVAGWLVLVALAAPFAMQLGGALKAGGFSDPRGESVRAQETVERAFAEAPNSLLVVLHDPAGAVASAVPAARAAADGDQVAAITDYRANPEWLSEDGATTFLQVEYTADNTTVQNLVPGLQAEVAGRVGDGLDVRVTGAPALDYALNAQTKRDVARAEMIAFPVLFVVLLVVFRSVASMVVPLVVAAATLALAQAVGYGIAQVTDLNSLFTSIATMIGLAVAVDYSLFIIKRFREELARGSSVPEAVERSMSTAGHAVLFSGMAVIVALSGLFIPRAMSFTSIALGGVTVTLVAVALTMTLLPALLRLLGHRINWGTLRRRRAPGAAAAGAASGVAAGVTGAAAGAGAPAAPQTPPRRPELPAGATTGRAAALVRRPGAVLALLAIGFVALALPATQLDPRVPVASADILPEQDDARVGFERVRDDIGVRDMFPVQVVLTGGATDAGALLDSATAVSGYASRAAHADGVLAVDTLGIPAAQLTQALTAGGGLPAPAQAGVAQLWQPQGDTVVTRVLVTPAVDPDAAEAKLLVEDLRAELPSLLAPGVTAEVTGATAVGADFDRLVLRSVPLVIAWVALLSLVILLVAFRSLLLPLLALLFNAAVVAASLGVLSLVFTGAGNTVNSVTPLMLFAVMFGLSMDYMVIMISRMREMYFGGLSHREAVLGGLARTAGMINGAAAIMVAVFLSFLSADIRIVAELGVCLAVAVVLDAVVIRRLALPSALLLIGERIWGRRRPGAGQRTVSSGNETGGGSPIINPIDHREEAGHVVTGPAVR